MRAADEEIERLGQRSRSPWPVRSRDPDSRDGRRRQSVPWARDGGRAQQPGQPRRSGDALARACVPAHPAPPAARDRTAHMRHAAPRMARRGRSGCARIGAPHRPRRPTRSAETPVTRIPRSTTSTFSCGDQRTLGTTRVSPPCREARSISSIAYSCSRIRSPATAGANPNGGQSSANSNAGGIGTSAEARRSQPMRAARPGADSARRTACSASASRSVPSMATTAYAAPSNSHSAPAAASASRDAGSVDRRPCRGSQPMTEIDHRHRADPVAREHLDDARGRAGKRRIPGNRDAGRHVPRVRCQQIERGNPVIDGRRCRRLPCEHDGLDHGSTRHGRGRHDVIPTRASADCGLARMRSIASCAAAGSKKSAQSGRWASRAA